MKLTKSRLKEIIKEETSVLNEDLAHAIEVLQDPEKQKIIAQAFAQIGLNLSPAVLGSIALLAIRRALGFDKEVSEAPLDEEKDEKWIQGAEKDIEKRGTEGVCTGEKFGGPTCRPGTKRYNLAKTFRKMAKDK